MTTLHSHLKERRTLGAIAAAVALSLGFGANAATAADALIDPSVPANSLAGKRVLLSPYWLDTFGTANASWLTRLLEPYGVKVDAVNPNGVASKQQDVFQTALTSHNYDVVV